MFFCIFWWSLLFLFFTLTFSFLIEMGIKIFRLCQQPWDNYYQLNCSLHNIYSVVYGVNGHVSILALAVTYQLSYRKGDLISNLAVTEIQPYLDNYRISSFYHTSLAVSRWRLYLESECNSNKAVSQAWMCYQVGLRNVTEMHLSDLPEWLSKFVLQRPQ